MGGTNDQRGRAGHASPISTPERDTARRDAIERQLRARLGSLSLDELRVVDVIVTRLIGLGRDSYAPLDLARDERDWGKEAAEELADTLFYLACREVAANDRRLERLRCEAADEIAGRVEPGLRELRDSEPEPITDRRPMLEFEMLDDRFDDGGET